MATINVDWTGGT